MLAGAAFGLTGLPLPAPIGTPLALLGSSAIPLSLIVLGMGLAEYGVRDGWRPAAALAVVKLDVFPLVVFAAARALALTGARALRGRHAGRAARGRQRLPDAREFASLEGPLAASLVLTTLAAAVTTPVLLSLLR